MIQDAGLALGELEPEGMDQPFGLKTGAGIIFGNSGGVTEAVVRHVVGVLGDGPVLEEVRSPEGRRAVTLDLPGGDVRVAIVHGLANARALVEDVRAGRAHYDFVEVMACPGGCAGGAGQPVAAGAVRAAPGRVPAPPGRLHGPAGAPGERRRGPGLPGRAWASPTPREAHRLLHTRYATRRRLQGDGLALTEAGGRAHAR